MLNKVLLLCGGDKGPILTVDLTEVPLDMYSMATVNILKEGSFSGEDKVIAAEQKHLFPIDTLAHATSNAVIVYVKYPNNSHDYVDYWKVITENMSYWDERPYEYGVYASVIDITKDAYLKICPK